MAVGLDRGSNFQAILAEERLKCKTGDVLMLYTDGVTEARNWQHQEFEEQRLCQVVAQYHSRTAEEIKKQLLQEISTFVGDHERHDDLTMVVIKVR